MRKGQKIRILKLDSEISDKVIEVYDDNGEVGEAEEFLRKLGHIRSNERLYDFRHVFTSGGDIVPPRQIRVLVNPQ